VFNAKKFLLLLNGDRPQSGQRNANIARNPCPSQKAPPKSKPCAPNLCSKNVIQIGKLKNKIRTQAVKSQHLV
jgi:hypothetical protein